MLTIHLHNLEFHAFHGLYPEESVLGNRFIVSMDVQTDIHGDIKTVNDTIDYGSIYEAIRKNMQQPSPLLEQLAERISEEVHRMSHHIISSTITIKKMAAPLGQFKGEVGISYSKKK